MKRFRMKWTALFSLSRRFIFYAKLPQRKRQRFFRLLNSIYTSTLLTDNCSFMNCLIYDSNIFFRYRFFFKLSYLASSFFGNFFRNLLGNKFKFFDVFIRNLICIYVFQAIFFSIVIKFRSIKLELSGKFCILDNFVSEISWSFH